MNRRLILLALVAACGGRIEPVGSSSDAGVASVPTGTAEPAPLPGRPPPPSPPPPSPTKKQVTARVFAGGLDHLEIYAADYITDSCVAIHLTHPESVQPGEPFASVTVPPEWAVANARRIPGAKSCEPGAPTSAAERAEDGKGSIDFVVAPNRVFPCRLSVHVELLFAKAPALELVDGEDVPVIGCE